MFVNQRKVTLNNLVLANVHANQNINIYKISCRYSDLLVLLYYLHYLQSGNL